MQTRIIYFAFLLCLWLALAVAIWLRAYERWLNPVEDWRRYTVVALALLGAAWNMFRLMWLLRLKKRKEPKNASSF